MIEEKPWKSGRLYALSRDAMKEHSREGERRREMGGPPNPPARGAAAPPPPPPASFQAGHACKSFRCGRPQLDEKGGIAHKPFALQYGFETRARVARGDRCFPTRRALGYRRCLPTRRGWDPAGCVTTEAAGCSRLDGSNAQVQNSGEQPVARYTSRASGAVKKR